MHASLKKVSQVTHYMHISLKQVKSKEIWTKIPQKTKQFLAPTRAMLSNHIPFFLFFIAPTIGKNNLSCIFNRTQKAPPAGGDQVLPAKDGIKYTPAVPGNLADWQITNQPIASGGALSRCPLLSTVLTCTYPCNPPVILTFIHRSTFRSDLSPWMMKNWTTRESRCYRPLYISLCTYL